MRNPVLHRRTDVSFLDWGSVLRTQVPLARPRHCDRGAVGTGPSHQQRRGGHGRRRASAALLCDHGGGVSVRVPGYAMLYGFRVGVG